MISEPISTWSNAAEAAAVVDRWYTTLSPSYLLQCQTRATTWLQISALHRAPGHVPLLHHVHSAFVRVPVRVPRVPCTYISASVALPAGYTSLVCLCSWQLRRRTLPILVLNLMISQLRAPCPPCSNTTARKVTCFRKWSKFGSRRASVPAGCI